MMRGKWDLWFTYMKTDIILKFKQNLFSKVLVKQEK